MNKKIFLFFVITLMLIYFIPHLFFIYFVHKESKGVAIYDPFVGDGDLLIYAGRIHQVLEGKLPLNIYTYEHNEFPYFFDFLLELIYGIYCLLFFGKDLILSYVFYTPIISALGFLSVYFLFKILSKEDYYSFFVASTFILFAPHVVRPWNPLFGDMNQGLRFWRIINMGMSFTWLIITFYFFFMILQRKGNKKIHRLGFIAFSGLIFHTYFYAWTTYIIFLSLAFFYLFVKEAKTIFKNAKKRYKTKFWRLSKNSILVFLLAFPAFLNKQIYTLKFGKETFYKLGLIKTTKLLNASSVPNHNPLFYSWCFDANFISKKEKE